MRPAWNRPTFKTCWVWKSTRSRVAALCICQWFRIAICEVFCFKHFLRQFRLQWRFFLFDQLRRCCFLTHQYLRNNIQILNDKFEFELLEFMNQSVLFFDLTFMILAWSRIAKFFAFRFQLSWIEILESILKKIIWSPLFSRKENVECLEFIVCCCCSIQCNRILCRFKFRLSHFKMCSKTFTFFAARLKFEAFVSLINFRTSFKFCIDSFCSVSNCFNCLKW